MIGNDIIDLRLAAVQSNWQRKGFLNKLFTEQEQHAILSSKDSFQAVWHFWSMKESAYKVYMQQHGYRFFAPKKIACQLRSKTTGMVRIHHDHYSTISQVTNAHIFTEATVLSSTAKKTPYFEIDTKFTKNESLHARIKKVISQKRGIPYRELTIKKNTIGIPKLYREDEQLEVLFSLTHHGNFGAISILNIKQ